MSSRDPIPTLRQRLSSARLELALAEIARRVALATWQWLVLAVVVVTVDALWPTAAPVRFVLAIALGIGLLRILWRCLPPRTLRRASPGRLAREIEQRCGLLHNPLITAVQLQVAPSVVGPRDVNSLLLARSAQRGEQAAHATGTTRLADRRSRTRSRLALLGAALFLIAAGLAAPRPISAVAWRLADPWGGHPPYTPLIFDLSFDPRASEIVYGDDAAATVRIAGGAVEHADLVCRDPAQPGAPQTRVPLQRARQDASSPAAAEFTAVLRDCRENLQVMVDTPRGRSEWLTIEPRQEPRWAARTMTIRGPRYAPNREPRRLPLSDRPEPVRVLQGSELSVEATSTLELRGALASPAGHVSAAVAADHLLATWSWIASETGSHEIDLTLVGPTGLHSTPTDLTIDVVPDAPPAVSIAQPPPSAAALPDQQFTAHLEALDDVAVKDMSFTAQVVRDGQVVAHAEPQLSSAGESSDRAAAGAHVDLAQFDLQPGDTVRLEARARDNRPDDLGGPQTSPAASCEILIIDEQTYAALAGRSAGAADQGEAGDQSAGAPDAAEGECEGEDGQAEASGAPGADGAGIASSGQTGEQIDGAAQGDQPSQGLPGEGAGQGDSPAPGEGEPSLGSGDDSAQGQARGSGLLEQARSRPLIQRDGSVEPVTGRTDPDGPRQHMTALDDATQPPPPAASRTTTQVNQSASGDAGHPLGSIPLRYRDLAARYFRRLAEDDAAHAREEGGDRE